MKKSFLLLPLSLVVLSACTSNSPAPISDADGNLSPSVIQSVNGSNVGGAWQPEIQKIHYLQWEIWSRHNQIFNRLINNQQCQQHLHNLHFNPLRKP